MKKWLLTCLLFVTAVESSQFFIEKVGPIENIYGSSGVYGTELNCRAWHNIYLWASGEYVEKSVEAIGYSFRTIDYEIPIGVGMKYLKFYPIDSVRSFALYAGTGGMGTYTETEWRGGAIVKTGFVYLNDPIFLDLFMSSSILQSYKGWAIVAGGGLTY